MYEALLSFKDLCSINLIELEHNGSLEKEFEHNA